MLVIFASIKKEGLKPTASEPTTFLFAPLPFHPPVGSVFLVDPLVFIVPVIFYSLPFLTPTLHPPPSGNPFSVRQEKGSPEGINQPKKSARDKTDGRPQRDAGPNRMRVGFGNNCCAQYLNICGAKDGHGEDFGSLYCWLGRR